jgi:hypothetical protein
VNVPPLVLINTISVLLRLMLMPCDVVDAGV